VRLLILDRDGVINHDSDAFIKSPEEWIPIPGSLEAIAHANRLGYRVVVISNQSGLARGVFDIGQLNKIHAHMLDEIARCGGWVEAVFFCPHGPHDGCACRKPRPGLLIDLGRRLGVDLKSAFLVGDRETDMAAAGAVGAGKILVKTGHGRKAFESIGDLSDITVCNDLAGAVERLSMKHW
jgi:D-glycero-D-manno-heptose 1,7-bisphosphate phosphatase